MTDVHCPKGGRHELIVEVRDSGSLFQGCQKCNRWIRMHRIVELANAAMQLTADEAETILKATKVYERVTDIPVLRAYARRWRGEAEGD